MPALLLDKAICDVFSFPFLLLLPEAGVGSDADGGGGGGGGGRAYSSVHRFAVLSCWTRFRMYSVATEGTSQHTWTISGDIMKVVVLSSPT